MSTPSRRAHFRVIYPLTERPAFDADLAVDAGLLVYEVVDCSELGLRFEVLDHRLPLVGTPMEGTVRFRRGESIDVAGEVLRAHSGMVVLSLQPPGIRFSDMMEEQRYLRARGYLLGE